MPRVLARVSSVEVLGIGFVRGRRFVYHKRSVDGSAKADAALTGLDNDRVWGVVYQINDADKQILDRYESLGVGYDQQLVDVIMQNHSLSSWLYFATTDWITCGLKPYEWYHRLIMDGATQHRLPFCYLREIAQSEVVADADLKRAQFHHRLIMKDA